VRQKDCEGHTVQLVSAGKGSQNRNPRKTGRLKTVLGENCLIKYMRLQREVKKHTENRWVGGKPRDSSALLLGALRSGTQLGPSKTRQGREGGGQRRKLDLKKRKVNGQKKFL